MEKLSVRQRSVADLAKRVLVFKRTIKQWVYYAGLKYLQKNKLTEPQEAFLADITDFFVEYIDEIEKDKDFLKKMDIGAVSLPIL